MRKKNENKPKTCIQNTSRGKKREIIKSKIVLQDGFYCKEHVSNSNVCNYIIVSFFPFPIDTLCPLLFIHMCVHISIKQIFFDHPFATLSFARIFCTLRPLFDFAPYPSIFNFIGDHRRQQLFFNRPSVLHSEQAKHVMRVLYSVHSIDLILPCQIDVCTYAIYQCFLCFSQVISFRH